MFILLAAAIAWCAAPQSAGPKASHRDVAYGPHVRHRLDLWLAKSEKPSPLVVYFHGGDFRGGNKSQVPRDLLEEALAADISVASADYRLIGDGGHFPDFMRDGARVVQCLRMKAGEYNLDPDRIAACGDSAGGTIALWLALHDDLADPSSEDPVRRQSSRLLCAGGFRTPTSCDPVFAAGLAGGDPKKLTPLLAGFYGLAWKGLDSPGSQALYDEASPLTHLTPDDPPVFLYYSGPKEKSPSSAPLSEIVHHYAFGKALKDKMDPLRIDCVLVHLDDISQGGPLFKDRFVPAERLVVGFFSRRFKAGGAEAPAVEPPESTKAGK